MSPLLRCLSVVLVRTVTASLYHFTFICSAAFAFGLGITFIAVVFPWGVRG